MRVSLVQAEPLAGDAVGAHGKDGMTPGTRRAAVSALVASFLVALPTPLTG
jgi:hypothetical protein